MEAVLAYPYQSPNKWGARVITGVRQHIGTILQATGRGYKKNPDGSKVLDSQGRPIRCFRESPPKISKTPCPRCGRDTCRQWGDCDGNGKKKVERPNTTQFPGATESAPEEKYRWQRIFNN